MKVPGNPPRTLGVFGVPAAVAIAILFLPLWPSMAQRGGNSQPPGQIDIDQAKAVLEKAKAELEATKARLEILQAEMQLELQQKMQRIEIATKEYIRAREIAKSEPRGVVPPVTRQAPAGGAPVADSMEKRIGAMEKKLDLILIELKALRKDPAVRAGDPAGPRMPGSLTGGAAVMPGLPDGFGPGGVGPKNAPPSVGIAPVPVQPAAAPSPGFAPAAGAVPRVPAAPAAAPVPSVVPQGGGAPDAPRR
jgi:hypothetical protein